MWFPDTKSISPENRAFSVVAELLLNSKLVTSMPTSCQIPALSRTSQMGRWVGER